MDITQGRYILVRRNERYTFVMKIKKWIIGIDEAGRGPLAGPVSVGVFAVEEGIDTSFLDGIRDSKKLSEKQRNEWYAKLSTCNARHAVGYASASYIDSDGIVQAVQKAMNTALQKLEVEPRNCMVYLDGGLRAPIEYVQQKTIIHGDATIPVISAAAIFAKVERDNKMLKLASQYPEYFFEKHKGYGTQLHREQLKKNGPCVLHRLTFCKNILHKYSMHSKVSK